MKPKILMDFDGTIFDFTLAFGNYLREIGIPIPPSFVPEKVHFELDPRLVSFRDEIIDAYSGFVKSDVEIPPFEGGIEFLLKVGEDWDLVYCTARREKELQDRAWSYFDKYKIPRGSLIFSEKKSKVASAMDVSVAMDDNPKIIIPLSLAGIPVIIKSAEYNRLITPPRSIHIKDFDEAYRALMKFKDVHSDERKNR